MLDTSKAPTLTDIACKARILASAAKAFENFALNATISDDESLNVMCDAVFALSEMASELEIMTGVADGVADFDYYLRDRHKSMKG